jgi:uncharacterized membrane-anchored protein
MMRRNGLLLAALALALAQIGFLSWIIMARAAVLRDGREILLKVEPVDPRDLLRGDYVRLGYEISQVPVGLLVDKPAGRSTTQADEAISVRLHRGDDGYWRVISARLGRPPWTYTTGMDVELLGSVYAGQTLDGSGTLRVDYGIERFYLPEGAGKPIERDMRVRSFGILAAVGSDGKPQIKALMDGETRLFEEPLY